MATTKGASATLWFSLHALVFVKLPQKQGQEQGLEMQEEAWEGQSLHCLLEDLGTLHHSFLFISASSTSNGFPHRRRWNARYVIRVHLPAVGIDPLSSV